MKKKIAVFMLIATIICSFLSIGLRAKAIGVETGLAIGALMNAGWDSTVAAYAMTKGMQFSQSSTAPQIIGDYVKPQVFSEQSISALYPLWESFGREYITDHWREVYPQFNNEQEAQLQWIKDQANFDYYVNNGVFPMDDIVYPVFNAYVNNLQGIDYIVPRTENKQFTLDSLNFPVQIPITGAGQIVYRTIEKPNYINKKITGIAVKPMNVTLVNSYQDDVVLIVYYEDGTVDCLKQYAIVYNGALSAGGNGWGFSAPADLQGFASYGTKANGEIITDTNTVPVLGYEETTEGEKIEQLPIGNPNDHDDKDNKKLTVLPNVPELRGTNDFSNVNGGLLPFRFPVGQDGLIPPIPVNGLGGVTVNIPVTNNSYQVINNYDRHSEIYNDNKQYPTINYEYVNYYVDNGTITYEQFLQALQDYFNVIVYNNENNFYYPTTNNNITNNYYTINEVIEDKIPPILPPSRIGISDRFPFSIPFDIYRLIKLFNAEPKAWEFDVPVPTLKSGGAESEYYNGSIGHIEYSETMHVSLEQWEPVALVMRTMFSVLWLLFLYFLFMKLVH